jgi:hypothetical protein
VIPGFSLKSGSTRTLPVKLAAGPFAVGREPLRDISELSAHAGEMAMSASIRMNEFSVVIVISRLRPI